jgi:hypothetical protein
MLNHLWLLREQSFLKPITKPASTSIPKWMQQNWLPKEIQQDWFIVGNQYVKLSWCCKDCLCNPINWEYEHGRQAA